MSSLSKHAQWPCSQIGQQGLRTPFDKDNTSALWMIYKQNAPQFLAGRFV